MIYSVLNNRKKHSSDVFCSLSSSDTNSLRVFVCVCLFFVCIIGSYTWLFVYIKSFESILFLFQIDASLVFGHSMSSHAHSYSNPIYDFIAEPNTSFSHPLMIDIEPAGAQPHAKSTHGPLLLLANRLVTPPSIHQQHNYVNQRIHDFIDDNEENFDLLYAKPRKRCVTLEDEPVIIPPKTSRFSLVTTPLASVRIVRRWFS